MTYQQARDHAQQAADLTGFDHGVERNQLFGTWQVFMLPARTHRQGFELRCEVVSATRWDKIRPGHGPGGAGK